MTEETTAQTEQKPAEATPDPTLEDLYREYNVGQPEQPEAAPATEQTPAVTDVAAIHKEVVSFRQELAAERQEQTRRAEEADLTKAVATLGTESELKGKESMLKGYLIAKASEDQRLRALWENRRTNPAAWSKALTILAGDVKSQFAVANPQIEENQRAMEESQRAGSTSSPAPQKPEDKMLQMNEAEFAQMWGRLAGRG